MLQSRLQMLAAVLFLLFANGLTAQLNRGTITGTVHDATGAVIAGVEIVIRNAETGAEYNTRSNPAGQYTMPNLPAGRYELTFEVDGFKRFVRSGIIISATDVARVDATLELGATTESISVTAALSRLQTDTPEVASNLNNADMVDIPFSFANGRLMENITYKVLPGVFGNRWTNNINGSINFSRDALLDGATMTSWTQGVHVLTSVSMEAVEEFKVMSSGISAEFGRTAGAVYNYVMKSGTNTVHGSAYGSLRNEALNANTFGNNAASRPRSKERRWNYAFSGGGPVYIPRLYDGRNKTFFYAAFEHYKERTVQFDSPNQTVPLPAFYEGDFSRLLRGRVAGTDALGRSVEEGAIYDPNSFEQLPNGRWIGEPFAGNRIPVARFSQVARNLNAIAKDLYVPTFRDASGQIPLVNNYFRTITPLPFTDDYFFSLKIDHNINERHKLTGSFNRDHNIRTLDSSALWGIDPKTQMGGELGTGFWRDEPAKAGRIAYDWIISPSVLNHLNVHVNRYPRGDANFASDIDGAAKLGIQGLHTIGYPQINWGGGPFVSLASVGFPRQQFVAGTAYGFMDTVSFTKGRHFFKSGVDIRTNQWNVRPTQGGQINFAARSTAIPNESFSGNLTGYSFASYLLGIVDSANLIDPVGIGMRLRYFSLFFQDDWKATPKLTVNLGLRWEHQPPVTEVNDLLSSWNPDKIDPQTGLRGAYDFAGDCSACTGKRYFGQKSYRDFAPRIGLAYRLRENWTIRAAYGIYYAPEMFDSPEGGSPLGKLTNVQAGGTFQLDPVAVNPWRGLFNWDAGFPQGGFVPAGTDVSWGNRNRPGMIDPAYGRTGYSQNWNVNIQRLLPGNIVLDAGYVGTKATGFKSGLLKNLNQLPAKALSDFGRNLGNSVTSPQDAAANGVAYPYTGFRGTVASALRPYPQVQGNQTIRVWGAPIGHQTYHSFQLTLNRQFSQGLTLYTNYVWSKTLTNIASLRDLDNGNRPLDYYNLSLEKAVSEQDLPSFLKIYVNYELPFARNSGTGLKNALLRGWAVSAVLNYGSGRPLVFTGSSPNSQWNGVANRVNVSSGELKNKGLDKDKFDASSPSSPSNTFLVKDQFSNPLPDNLGTASRTTPGARESVVINEDIAIIKNTYFGEKYRFQIRADMTNALNRNYPVGIVTNVTSPLFGQATSRGCVIGPCDPSRTLQIGMRLDF